MYASVHSLIREELLKKKEKNIQKSPTPLRIAELTRCPFSPLVSYEVIRKLKRDFDFSLFSSLMLFYELNISRLQGNLY